MQETYHKKVKTFLVFPIGQHTNDEYQGILWPSGKVFIGLDVWRMLNPADTPEYGFQKYESLERCLERYEVKRRFDAYYKEVATK